MGPNVYSAAGFIKCPKHHLPYIDDPRGLCPSNCPYYRPSRHGGSLGRNDALSQFNACLEPYRKRVEWIFDKTIIDNNIPVCAVKLFVDGDCWGYGRGITERAAMIEAAKQGHKRIGIGCGCEEYTLIISQG